MGNKQSQQTKKEIFSTETSKSAIFQTIQTRREVKIFAVTESELTTLSFLNTLIVAFVSSGSALLSVTVTIGLDAIMAESPISESIKFSLKTIAFPFFCGSLLFFWLGWKAHRQKKSDLEKIQRESDTG